MKAMQMEANDLSQGTSRQVGVMPLGFDTADVERLKKIFEYAPPGGRRYAVADPASGQGFDVLLVNYDNPAALGEKNARLGSVPGTPVVAVSRGPLGEIPLYHLRGMLIGARVLGLLDKIPLAEPPAAPVQPRPVLAAVSAPLPPAAPQDVPVAAVVEARPEPAVGYRALVVDDSVSMQKSLEMNLVTLDQIARVDFADSGEAALEKAQAMKYDLIFLDVMMPGIDGYETCSRLRKLPQYKKTPIIMVSGKNSPLDEVKGVIAGCTTYLTKPVQQEAFQKLSRRVLAWLENYQPGSGKPAH